MGVRSGAPPHARSGEAQLQRRCRDTSHRLGSLRERVVIDVYSRVRSVEGVADRQDAGDLNTGVRAHRK